AVHGNDRRPPDVRPDGRLDGSDAGAVEGRFRHALSPMKLVKWLTSFPKLVNRQMLWLSGKMSTVRAIRALANERRLQILAWLKEPPGHFPRQIDGDLESDGVCGVLIAAKLGVSQPTVSEHMRVLVEAGLIRAKRIKQWTFYRRDEARIAAIKQAIRDE